MRWKQWWRYTKWRRGWGRLRGRNGGDVESWKIESNSKKTHGWQEERVEGRDRLKDSGSIAGIKINSTRSAG